MEKTYEAFISSKYYKADRLPKENEDGTWVVMSADTNPDYNGSHCTHPLMVVKGTFRQAVERALQIPDYEFYCYGFGEVEKIEYINLNEPQGEDRK